MKKLNSKLRSRSGASLMIALVFLLFCVLVGGSVLAAATANASRVKYLAQQQDYLDQRSAALLLAERLKTEPGMQVMISDTQSHKELGSSTGTWTKRPGVMDDVEERTVLVEVQGEVNPLQQLMVETAILKYLGGSTVDSLKVLYTETGIIMTDIQQFSCVENAVVAEKLLIRGGEANNLDASIFCTDSYDFIVDMQVGSGQNGSRTIVETTAASEQKSYALPQQYSQPFIHDTQTYVWRMTETVTYTVISWILILKEKFSVNVN